MVVSINKNFGKIVYILSIASVCSQDLRQSLLRHVRTLYQPLNSGVGIAVALAVPIEGNVDASVSFCIGFGPGPLQLNTPEGPGLDPPLFTKILEGRQLDETRKKTEKRSPIRYSEMTRRKFYRLFADNLKQQGFDPHYCLLKAICEAAKYDFGYNNGVVGDLVHVLFTPSTSKDEQLNDVFYEAEENGHRNLCEEEYSSLCPTSIFDLISMF